MTTLAQKQKLAAIAFSMNGMIESLSQAYAANLNDLVKTQSSKSFFIFEEKSVGAIIKYDNENYFIQLENNKLNITKPSAKTMDLGVRYLKGSNDFYSEFGDFIMNELTLEEIEDLMNLGGVIFTEDEMELKDAEFVLEPYDFERINDELKELLSNL